MEAIVCGDIKRLTCKNSSIHVHIQAKCACIHQHAHMHTERTQMATAQGLFLTHEHTLAVPEYTNVHLLHRSHLSLISGTGEKTDHHAERKAA